MHAASAFSSSLLCVLSSFCAPQPLGGAGDITLGTAFCALCMHIAEMRLHLLAFLFDQYALPRTIEKGTPTACLARVFESEHCPSPDALVGDIRHTLRHVAVLCQTWKGPGERSGLPVFVSFAVRFLEGCRALKSVRTELAGVIVRGICDLVQCERQRSAIVAFVLSRFGAPSAAPLEMSPKVEQ
jgi:hypothetical protein